ncbi:hypothetical protein CIRMBP1315_00579 [Enterococcus cecorum]|uniref:DUF262 domain-containing protein n=1 Tax=Enterococcus cecorum TaxID=44008 RepID=UPI000642C5E0|nr:DUF262 domain-containing protein [Enterococcus cecorum]KLO65183.1 hypothetical protein AA986_08170 [Enterococcus cecorum]CAI3367601.1 hypothetical protein CIRMBP1315_00579 [Enterococcus cecorum]
MKKIEGSPKNLKQLLQNTKYSIHYYQREYMWQRKHIEELIDDLTSEFLDYYKTDDPRQAVADYGAYFMGSIVLAGRENAIIDGQQRFSSLTLLLMYLNNRLKSIGQSYNMIETMIFSESFGTKSFNINVDDRQDCMNAIFNDTDFDTTGVGESVKNLYGRYQDIQDVFLADITDEMLLHFCDWVAEKVFFIEIVATTEQDAHKVFVTMNDRGLSLTSTEMLKGYILSEIKSDSSREKMNGIWKDKVLTLKKDDDKGDETFIKAWLRAHYAETIRETKAGAVNKDFDIIGGSFHKWVRDERDKLGLNGSDDFELFIKKFAKFAEVYERIRKAEITFAEETKYVYYNAQVNFTLQPQLLLATVCYEDSWPVIIEKINLVARFIDVLIVSRVTNYRSVDYSTIKNFVFNVTKDIRMTDIPTLKQKLEQQYINLAFDPAAALSDLRLNSFTKKYIKNILARITGYIEEQTGVASNYCNYMNTQTKNPFEIEHIITDHYEWVTAEYSDQDDFRRWRNSIGALLLLHKSINASLNDSKYDYKLKKYCSNEGNIYTESLGELAYQNNFKFKKFIADNNLGFKAYASFGKNEITERIAVLVDLVKLVWNDDMFM